MSAPRGWNPELVQPASDDADEWALLHATVFGAGAGRKLLEAYHKRVIDKVLPELADERALLVSNAQRHFVRELERLTDLGLKPKKT